MFSYFQKQFFSIECLLYVWQVYQKVSSKSQKLSVYHSNLNMFKFDWLFYFCLGSCQIILTCSNIFLQQTFCDILQLYCFATAWWALNAIFPHMQYQFKDFQNQFISLLHRNRLITTELTIKQPKFTSFKSNIGLSTYELC